MEEKTWNKKLVKEYLIITFLIMILSWGTSAIISQLYDITVKNIIIQILFMIGGFSPTIASYISLKRNKKVKNFKEWLKKVFDIKHSIYVYGLVALFVVVYYAIGCYINGFRIGAPIIILFVTIPMMLFGGGNEEAGWRMILWPELEKKFGFSLATIITGIIWWLWHLPIFFIKGTANETMNYLLFGIMCLTLSYAMGTVRKISNGVFPCILMHCLINGISAVFVFNYGIVSSAMTLAATIIISIFILKINKKVKV